MPDSSHAPFDPRRLEDRQRPGDIVSRMFGENGSGRDGLTEIRIIGVGGAGNNAINRMVDAGLSGVEFVAVNSDAQDLTLCHATRKIAIGERTTRHLGAGGDPALGERSANENEAEIEAAVADADMVFVTAGMGGGTGTGAAPVIARLAMDAGALTVGVVTSPFSFEGSRRREIAEQGIENLSQCVDSMVIVNNDRLLGAVHKNTTVADAFVHADAMLLSGVRGVTDLITNVGIVNVDFADVKSIVKDAGLAILGVGTASGESRAQAALEEAIHSPLIDTPLEGASGILVNITGGEDLGIHEVESIVEGVAKVARPDARIVFGAVVDPRPGQTLTVTIIATGLSEAGPGLVRAAPRRRVSTQPRGTSTENGNRSETGAAAPVDRVAETFDRVEPPPLEPASPQPILHEMDVGSVADPNDTEVPAFIRRRSRNE